MELNFINVKKNGILCFWDKMINNFLICYYNYLNCIEKIVFDVMLIN